MQQKNYKIFIYPIVALAIFTLLIFAAGFAYFNSTLTMTTSNYQVNLPLTTSLICTKTDCNATVTPAMMANTNTNSTTAKTTSNCSISCTCSGTQGAICNYDVRLNQTGTTYTPSAGLGSSNEFTVKVTAGTGCTIQNSSSTATQVNTMKDKVVANCALTVPAGGSVTSATYAEFKWYNLNLDQTAHARKTYSYVLTNDDNLEIPVADVPYDISTGNGVIYRYSSQEASIGNNISVLNNGYSTSYEDINKQVYLKHQVSNNIITASYACTKYTVGGILTETCVRGGDSSYFGTFDGIENYPGHPNVLDDVSSLHPTGNIKILQDYKDESGDYCEFSSTSVTCLYIGAAYTGGVYNNYGDDDGCYISENGRSGCY